MVYTEATKRATNNYRLKNIEKMRVYCKVKAQEFREKHRERCNKERMIRYYRQKAYNDEAKRLRMMFFCI
jgi:hypothetical protein